MGLKDRVGKLEANGPEPDPPTCPTCGTSYATIVYENGRSWGSDALPQSCEWCEGPRGEWAEENGSINKIVVTEAAPSEVELEVERKGHERDED